MRKKTTLLVIVCILLFNDNFTFCQSLIRIDSSRVYLLAILKNTGKTEDSQANFFSCILLDSNSAISKLLPNTNEYYHYYSLQDSQNIKIEQEISKFFLANVAIGVGVSYVMTCMEILKGMSVDHPLYGFICDTVLSSQLAQTKDYSSDILNGEITKGLESGDLYFSYDSIQGYKPTSPQEFTYSNPGYYYWLTPLIIDFIMVEDYTKEILAASYAFLLYSRHYDKRRNILFTIGNTISAHLNYYSTGEYIPVALPYKVNIAE